MVNQFYKAEIMTEYVIRGNTAILKCNIPSFVADYVSVQAWISDDGSELLPSNENHGMAWVETVFGLITIFLFQGPSF